LIKPLIASIASVQFFPRDHSDPRKCYYAQLYFSQARTLNRAQSTVDRIGLKIIIDKSTILRELVLGVNIPPWFQFADVW